MSLIGAAILAGNLDSFPLGNEAALTGGAVIASTHDAAATWYNPAGLGALERDSIDGSASAISYRVYVLPSAVHVRAPNGGAVQESTTDATSSALLTVPASLVTARHLTDELSAGIGVFVQRQEFVSARAPLSVDGVAPVGPYHYDMAFGVVQQLATYYAGGALGYAFSPDLRVGVGLFGVYTTLTSFFDFGSNLTVNGAERATGVLERKASIDVFGVRPTAGIQWSPSQGWELGAMVRAPTVAFRGNQEVSGTDASTTLGAGTTTAALNLSDQNLTPSSITVIDATRVHVGFARVFKRGWIGMSADYQFPLHNADGTLMTTSVANAQIGGRYSLFDWLGLGLGFFTDRSPTPSGQTRNTDVDRIDHIGSARIHFVGLMGGVEYRHRYEVVKKGDEPIKPGHRGLEFSTTLAVRYARGRGTVQGAVIEPLNTGPIDYRPLATDATIHELNVHIGSALYF